MKEFILPCPVYFVPMIQKIRVSMAWQVIKMEESNDVKITSYDRLMRAWENSMELARDFEVYSKRVDDEELKEVFKKFAEEEGLHAAKFRELLLKYQKENRH